MTHCIFFYSSVLKRRVEKMPGQKYHVLTWLLTFLVCWALHDLVCQTLENILHTTLLTLMHIHIPDLGGAGTVFPLGTWASVAGIWVPCLRHLDECLYFSKLWTHSLLLEVTWIASHFVSCHFQGQKTEVEDKNRLSKVKSKYCLMFTWYSDIFLVERSMSSNVVISSHQRLIGTVYC